MVLKKEKNEKEDNTQMNDSMNVMKYAIYDYARIPPFIAKTFIVELMHCNIKFNWGVIGMAFGKFDFTYNLIINKSSV